MCTINKLSYERDKDEILGDYERLMQEIPRGKDHYRR